MLSFPNEIAFRNSFWGKVHYILISDSNNSMQYWEQLVIVLGWNVFSFTQITQWILSL